MIHQLNCPACRHKLYFPSASNSYEHLLEGICCNCKYKYTLEQAEVKTFDSAIESLHSNTYANKYTTRYKRIYRARLLSANKTAKSIEFFTLGQEEKIAALPGDNLLLFYTMRGKKQEDLVWLKNYTTNQRYLLQRPGTKARLIGTAAGFLTLAAATVIATVLHIPLDKLFVAIVTPSAVGVGVAVTKRNTIKVSDRSELLRLGSEQQLLSQKFDLEQKSEALQQEFQSNSSLICRLQNLREQMLNTDQELYSRRIAVISNGIDILEKHQVLSQSLISGYQHLISMLAIDYETSRLAEQIPGDVTGKILRQLEKRKALEAQKLSLSLLVAPQKFLKWE